MLTLFPVFADINYCSDNSTLYTEKTRDVYENGIKTEYIINSTKDCSHGCSNSSFSGSAECNPSPIQQIIYIGLGIIIGFLILFWLIPKFIR